MHARDVMTTEVLTVTPDTPVREVARLLYERRISGAPVVDTAGKVVGMISEGDLMRHAGAIGDTVSTRSWWLRMFEPSEDAAADYARTHARVASQVMSNKVISVSPETPLSEIARMLEKNRVKRVPVISDGRLMGIVSRSNLLRGLAASPPDAPAAADDRTIGEAIGAELRDQPFGVFMHAIVQDRVVHLWGFIDSESERRAVTLIAENTPGVERVEDHMTNRPIGVA
ncbi:MAG: CBS domain-containing protein [Salinarimonadaceae bacterium]|nr:MAG: CBS domain-containing protein [Salinarimonadaceae bacterium]